MLKIGMYTCVSDKGNGREVDEGEWRLVKIRGGFSLTKITKRASAESEYDDGDVLVCKRGNGHPVREWDDGSLTVYPYQAGIPYYFTPQVGPS